MVSPPVLNFFCFLLCDPWFGWIFLAISDVFVILPSLPIHQINCQISPRLLISVRSSYTSGGLDCKAKRIQQARADGKRRKLRAFVGGALVWWEMSTSHGLPCILLGDGEGNRGASKCYFYHFWAMLGK